MGVSADRGTARLLACVLAMVMVACAVIAVAPGVNAADGTVETAPALSAADAYVYPDDISYEYVGERTITGNDVLMSYPVVDVTGETGRDVMNDFARLMGALHYYENSNVAAIIYDGVEYTWNEALENKGSNWAVEDGTTLVNAVVTGIADVTGTSIEMTVVLEDESTFVMTYGIAAVAAIGDVYYSTLQGAVDAAENNETVTLLMDAAGSGIEVKQPDVKNITIDFNTYTYTIGGPAVGSPGYESQAFHLEKDSTITLKNGTITSTSDSGVLMLVQNYSNLTLEDMVLDATNIADGMYAFSNNCGNITITGETIIKAPTNGYAFDVYGGFQSYGDVTVTIADGFTGEINGIVDLSRANNASNTNVNKLVVNADVAFDDVRATDGTIEIASDKTMTVSDMAIAEGFTVTNNGAIGIADGCSISMDEGATLSGVVSAEDASATFIGLKAGAKGLTISAGSIEITGTIDAGSQVTIDGTKGTVTIDGTVVGEGTTGGLTITGTTGEVIIGDVTVGEGAKLTAGGENVYIEGTVDATAEGAEFAASGTIQGEGTINGTVTITGNMNISSVTNPTMSENATLIVEDLTIESYNDVSAEGAIIVTGTFTYNGTEQLIVYGGVAQQVRPGQIYLAEGADYTGKVVVNEISNPVTGVIVNNINDANEAIALGDDVTIISLSEVDISGLQGEENVTVTLGTAVGDLDGFQGIISATQLGTQTMPAVINGVSYSEVKGTTITVTGVLIDIDEEPGYAYATDIAGTDIAGTVIGNNVTVIFNGIDAVDGITISAGSVIVSGTIDFDGKTVEGQDYPSTIMIEGGEDATGDGFVLENAEITGTGTISVGKLTIRGDVTIGQNVTILVGAGSELVVEEDSFLGGTGTVTVINGGALVVNGTVEDTVNMDVEESITVNDEEQFVSALTYYKTITLGANLQFGEEWDGKTITVNDKKIDLGEYDIILGGVFTDNNEKTVNVTMNLVKTQIPKNTGSFTVEEGATLGIDGSDIYMNVDVDEKATLNLSNNVTSISGASTKLSDVGFGKVLEFNDNFDLSSESAITLYGTINIAAGYTLNLDSGDNSIIVERTGSLVVDGTFYLDGELTVKASDKANMVVNGTMDVTGTIAGTVSNYGTITFDGTSADAIIDMYDGATLNVESVTGTLKAEGATDYQKASEKELTPIINGGVATLVNVKGVTIGAAETVVAAVTTGAASNYKAAEITVALDISGAVTAGTITVEDSNANVDEVPVTFNQTLDMADGVSLNFNRGEYTIVGTINAAEGATVTNNGIITVEGEMNFTAANVRDLRAVNAALGTINAVYYDVTGTDSVVRTFTGLSAAVGAASTADDKTIIVLGTVEVAEGATVTVPADVKVDSSAGNVIDVKGTLTFDNFAQSYGAQSGKINADVRIDADPARTYTSLANAIDMGMTDIVLNGDVTITSDITIPAGVTVSSGEFGVIIDPSDEDVKDDIALTVEGALVLYGNKGVTIQQDDEYEGSVVVAGTDGHIYSPADIEDVAGAHYYRVYTDADETEHNVYVVSTVMYAAADSANVAEIHGTFDITIKGAITVDSLVFTAPEDAQLTVTVEDMVPGSDVREEQSSLSFNSITLGKDVALASDGTELTGTVVMVDADGNELSAIEMNKADGIAAFVHVETDEEGAEYDCMEITGILIGGTVTISSGTVTVADGTITADDITGGLLVANGGTGATAMTGNLVVSNGATLSVPEGAFILVAADVESGKTAATVDGTLSINGGATYMYGAVINGTATVTDDGAIYVIYAEVNGTVDIADVEDEDNIMFVAGILVVGAKPTQLGTVAGAGTVNGKVDLETNDGLIKAYPGADLSGAQIDYDMNGASTAKSMTFNINGQAYMTVYSPADVTDVTVEDVLVAEEFELVGLYNGYKYATSTDNDGLYDVDKWFSSETMAPNTKLNADTIVGAYGNIYAEAEPATITGTLSVGVGIQLYIDDVPVNNQAGNDFELGVGQHTVRFEVQAQYDGSNVTISFNGQTVQNNGTFTIDANDTTFSIVATGATSAGSGEIVVNTGSGDMSLTDILLIVLVVLIVIMAVIVALRLMRS